MKRGPDFQAAPGLLIAVPQLDDPNFRHSVVVMVEHSPEGALGLVINHVLPHPCADVARTFELPWTATPDARLRRGGPVEEQSLWMLHRDTWRFEETAPVAPGVAVSRSRAALAGLCGGGEQHLRLLVGYSGWGPGQLEREVAEGSWIVGPTTAELVFEWSPEEIWSRALADLGIDPARLMQSSSIIQ